MFTGRPTISGRYFGWDGGLNFLCQRIDSRTNEKYMRLRWRGWPIWSNTSGWNGLPPRSYR